jgi:hypothetical protein
MTCYRKHQVSRTLQGVRKVLGCWEKRYVAANRHTTDEAYCIPAVGRGIGQSGMSIVTHSLQLLYHHALHILMIVKVHVCMQQW